ncbi:sugar phosphate isomerase/epimerase family protein [uncultured Novosphingobium sp.]|uniref:sugar phosphate isomerase/epimerase family protein n=1 Tax=uncultured Novosphingobium sp. TaxID=292277 RepID=UPI003748C0AF
MPKLGLEFLGAFGLSPVELVGIAADLDCQFISTIMEPMDYNPEGHARWSLRQDPKLVQELRAAARDTGVEIGLGDGFALLADLDVREAYARDLDIHVEIGTRRINTISFDPDVERTMDQFCQITEMATARGIEITTEFCPIAAIATLDMAKRTVDKAGPPATILLDTMHFHRSGATTDELRAMDKKLIGHIQLCDVPQTPLFDDYMEEALYERGIPGDGVAPLSEILAALPQVEYIGLEMPLRSLMEQGVGVKDRMARCVAGARKVMAGAAALEQA